ncbi:MAG: tRNA (adenosine(37)-N6)-threonylcarbamoyltransferase complex ATPase subunit type 1 TsaE [Pseudomonadota bacterium]
MTSITERIPSEAAMARFGAHVARIIAPGDRIALEGDLGAGKTTLARAIIRTLADDPSHEVPSPTFTIVQAYDLRVPLDHVDLYRIEDDAAVDELGLDDTRAALVEWPRTPFPITIGIAFDDGGDADARTLTLTAPDAFLDRLARQKRLAAFLQASGWGKAERRHLNGDASTRRYERLHAAGTDAVLMDAPSHPTLPGSYAQKARLADGNMAAFLAVGARLAAEGLTVPKTLSVNEDDGFLLMEDLGDHKIAGPDGAIAERYTVALDALAAFHQTPFRPPLHHPVAGQPPYMPPPFDADLSDHEVSLFAQWYLRAPLDGDYQRLWRRVIDGLWRGDDHLALRDVHSPNLMWLGGRDGIARVGLIDYQDAMIAPSAYDVVSLLQDARVDVPDALEAELMSRYIAARQGLDEERWRTAYHILGAQRATRILGVFRRLNDRDGKPHYLPHLPRLRRQLSKNLTATPALSSLRDWYGANTQILDAA